MLEELFKDFETVDIHKDGDRFRIHLYNRPPTYRCWGDGTGKTLTEAIEKARASFEHNERALGAHYKKD